MTEPFWRRDLIGSSIGGLLRLTKSKSSFTWISRLNWGINVDSLAWDADRLWKHLFAFRANHFILTCDYLICLLLLPSGSSLWRGLTCHIVQFVCDVLELLLVEWQILRLNSCVGMQLVAFSARILFDCLISGHTAWRIILVKTIRPLLQTLLLSIATLLLHVVKVRVSCRFNLLLFGRIEVL